MSFWIRGIADHPLRSVLLVVGLLSALAPGLTRLEIDDSTRSMFLEDSKEMEWQREFAANFLPDSKLTVVFRAKDVFDPDAMSRMHDLASDLEALEEVDKVHSLFTIDYPVSVGNVFTPLPVIEKIPKTETEAGELRAKVLANPIFRGVLVNESGTAAALFPTRRGKPVGKRVVDEIQAVLDSGRETGLDAYLVGEPVISKAIVDNIWHDLTFLGPIALIVIVATILLLFRWGVAAVFYFATGSLSVVATLGFMGWAGIEITSLVSIVVILILVVGCTEDIHLISEYVLGIEEGKPKADALRAVTKIVFRAVFLTSISTALGFYSTILSPIEGLKEFAVACGTGILLNFAFTILLAPALLRLGKAPRRCRVFGGGWETILLSFCVRTAGSREAVVGLVAAFAAAILLAGIARVEVDTDYIDFFAKHSRVRQDHEKFSSDFGGRSLMVVTIETHSKGGARKPRSVPTIGVFHDRLGEEFDHVAGFVDYLREFLYQTGKSADRERGELSMSQGQIDRCRFRFGNRFLGKYLDYDGSRTAIWIRSSIDGSRDIRLARKKIYDIAEEILPREWEIRVIGKAVSTAVVADSITKQLIVSVILLTAVVAFVLILFLRSWKLGLLAIIPNIFPVLVTFGFMGWAGISLGAGTFAVAMAAFGIAVDDTIHLILRFTHESREASDRSFKGVLERALRREIFPVVATSTTLVLGFSVLLFSGFQIHRETGLLFIVAIIAALIADLFVTPLILRGVYRGQLGFSKGRDRPSESWGHSRRN